MTKILFIVLIVSYSLFGETTMCFKKNWSDPTTIESTPLDGGKCSGEKSLEQMKQDGWDVHDIKLSKTDDQFTMNYIYVLKKSTKKTTIAVDDLKKNLKQIKQDNAKAKKILKEQEDLARGKKIYTSTCARCHGKNAQEEAYNSARPLVSLTLKDIQESIRSYSLDEKDNGMAILMKPYADTLSYDDIPKVYKYIQSLQ